MGPIGPAPVTTRGNKSVHAWLAGRSPGSYFPITILARSKLEVRYVGGMMVLHNLIVKEFVSKTVVRRPGEGSEIVE